jgi:hypothetical protein
MTNLFFVQFCAGTLESLGNLVHLGRLCLHRNQLSGQFFYFSGWSVPTDHLRPPSFRFFAGELPLSIVKKKTWSWMTGFEVQLSFNTGFTLPTNMNELGNIKELDLSDCSLTGPFFCSLGDGRAPLTSD